jgi:polar amino acid transport system substrate-binding protein
MNKLAILLSMILLTAGSSSLMARSLQEIRDSGTLKVGVAKVIPWVMTDADGALIGSEIDIATLLASDLGVEEKVSVLMWTQLIPILQSGDIDVIISGMAITPSRALMVDFTNPYGDSPVSLLARRDSPAAKASDVPAMNQENTKIGATRGTLSADIAHQQFYSAQVMEFPSLAALFSELEAGHIDAIVSSQPFPHLMSLQHPEKYAEPIEEPLYIQVEAMAVQQGNQSLLNFLNAWIAAKKAEGYMESNHEYWFMGTDWLSRIVTVEDEKTGEEKTGEEKIGEEKVKDKSTSSPGEKAKK